MRCGDLSEFFTTEDTENTESGKGRVFRIRIRTLSSPTSVSSVSFVVNPSDFAWEGEV